MASDLRSQLRAQLVKAREDYIGAIHAHSDVLTTALESEGFDVHSEYQLVSEELDRKHEAYRQATDDIRAVNSRQ
jgi:hypothetical protein